MRDHHADAHPETKRVTSRQDAGGPPDEHAAVPTSLSSRPTTAGDASYRCSRCYEDEFPAGTIRRVPHRVDRMPVAAIDSSASSTLRKRNVESEVNTAPSASKMYFHRNVTRGPATSITSHQVSTTPTSGISIRRNVAARVHLHPAPPSRVARLEVRRSR